MRNRRRHLVTDWVAARGNVADARLTPWGQEQGCSLFSFCKKDACAACARSREDRPPLRVGLRGANTQHEPKGLTGFRARGSGSPDSVTTCLGR